MAWEQRGNGKYYTRSVWAKGRVQRRYLGKGKAAAVALFLDNLIAGKMTDYRSSSQRLEEQCKQVISLGRQIELISDLMVAASLSVSNLERAGEHLWNHRPHFPWLREEDVDVDLVRRLYVHLQNAQKVGRRKAAVSALNALLDGNSPLWPMLDNLADRLKRLLLALIGGGDELRKRIENATVTLSNNLVGNNGDRIIRLLADRAALAWLEVCFCTAAIKETEGFPFCKPIYLPKQMDVANQRQERSKRTLQQLSALLAAANRPDQRGSEDW